jgi:hypothetical protein
MRIRHSWQGKVFKSVSPMSDPPHRQKKRHIVAAVISFIFLVAFVSPPAICSSRAEKNQDIVFLVDTSSSMLDIFDDVRQAILDYVLDVRPGDNVVVITFGEAATLRIRQKISSDADIKFIERELAGLVPEDYHTNITGALDKGLKELERLDREYPEHLKTVVLMSDGKNNPPDTTEEHLTFEEILKKHKDIVKFEKTGLALFYLSLGDDPDPQVLSFMEDIQGLSFDLGKDISEPTKRREQPLTLAQVFVEPISIDLGVVSGPDVMVPASIAFFPSRGNPANNTISTGMRARFRDNPSWKTLVEVRPSTISCSTDPWSTILFFNVESLEEGTIVGTLELKPLHGQVLLIEPSEIPVTVTIRQPRVRVVQEGRLVFGPVKPQTDFKETQRVLLMPNEAATEELIEAGSGIEIPEGMSLKMDIQKGGDQQELAVTVKADKSFNPGHSMTLEGTIYLSGTKHKVAFSRDKLELRIEVAPPPAPSRAIVVPIKKFFSRVGKWIGFGLIGVILISIAGMGRYWWVNLRPQSALEGKLVLVRLKGKTINKSKPIRLNLHNIGKTLGRDSLMIGSSKSAGITLAHKSVSGHHCQISAEMDKGAKRLFLELCGEKRVKINGEKITEPTPLSDRDLIKIGAYTFRFENPHPYRQIVVRYLDGRIMKGTPASWDIETDGFGLLPRDALPGSTEEAYITFRNLKAVYFVRDFDGQIGKKLVSPKSQIHGIHMKLTFHDKEEVEGYTSEAYDAESPRFYFFPADQSGNIISILVERENLKNIEIFEKEKVTQH